MRSTSSPCYCQILHKIIDIGSIATTAVIAIAAIFVLPQVRRLPCFGEYRHHHILQDLHMTIVIIILSLILTDKVDPNSEQAIYWITGINLSTFSFSRSDDPDASGLVFVWPLISKSWIDRIARKIITSQHSGGSRQHRGQRPPRVQHRWERLRGKVDVSYRATEFWC